MSFRLAQINETIHAELGSILFKTIEESPLGLITITKVETTPDLRFAVVWVSFLENKDHKIPTNLQRYLEGAAKHMRRELAKRLSLRHIPELHFRIDHAAENYEHIERLIAKMNEKK